MRWAGRTVAVVFVLGLAWSARAAPALKSGTVISLEVVSCSEHNPLDCALAGMILPDGWIDIDVPIVFDGAADKLAAKSSLISVTAKLGQNHVPDDLITLSSAKIVGGRAQLHATIDRAKANKLEADEYVGSLVVALDGEPATIDIPVDLRVRNGPFWAVICIIIGLALGIGQQYRKDYGDKVKIVLDQLRSLEGALARDPAPAFDTLARALAEVRRMIKDGKLVPATELLGKLETRRDQLALLHELEAVVGADDPDIDHARSALRRGDDDAATKLVKKIQTTAAKNSGLESLGAEPESVAAPQDAPVEQPSLGPWLWFVQHVLGRLLRGAGLVLLALLGIKTLYIDGGSTFGAHPLYDHLMLIFWGLGSEISSRGLGDLASLLGKRFPVPSEPTEKAEKPDKPEPPSKPKPEDEVHLPASKITEQGDGALEAASSWPGDHLDLDALAGRNLLGNGTTIAIIDTGCADSANLDKARIARMDIVTGAPGDDNNGHGTCMVALIASDRGVCPGAKVLSIRALRPDGTGAAEHLAAGVDIAVANKVDVISISAGQASPNQKLADAVKKAIDAGIVVIGSIRSEAPSSDAYPAKLPGCIAVSASNIKDQLLFPNPPPWVTVAAPGVDIPTYSPAGAATITGASPATAITAGICARLLSSKTGVDRKALAKKLNDLLSSTASARMVKPLDAATKMEKL